MVLHRTRYYPLAVRVLAGLCFAIAAIIALFLVLILLEANKSNPLVSFIGDIAKWFAWLFHDMFTADNAKVQALINYGLAALFYVFLGGLVHGVGSRVVD